MKKVLKSVDVMKFIMSLCVVTIHCYIVEKIPIKILNNFLTCIIFMAVPFFYGTSGYLLYKDFNFDEDGNFRMKLKKYILHIFSMYVIWFIIYNVEDIYMCVVYLSAREFFDIAKRFFLWGNGHLWYLWAIIIILPIMHILVKKVKPLYIVYIGFFLTCFFRFYSHYGSVEIPNWWQKPFVYLWQGKFLNIFGLCYSFAYISVGVYLALTDEWKKLSNKNLFGILLLFILLCCFIDNGAVSIFYQPIVFVLLVLCLRFEIESDNWFIRKARNYSTYIYLSHVYAIALSAYIFDMSVVVWIMSIVFSIVFSYIILKIKKLKLITRL